MDRTCVKLTVYFEEPFWVGVFEQVVAGQLSVCKVTFGAEPKDQEILEFILGHYGDLRFSPALDVTTRQAADNPKRRQRNARKQVRSSGIGTKSQQALQQQREEMKDERRHVGKERREEERRRKFDLQQHRRKERHRGH